MPLVISGCLRCLKGENLLGFSPGGRKVRMALTRVSLSPPASLLVALVALEGCAGRERSQARDVQDQHDGEVCGRRPADPTNVHGNNPRGIPLESAPPPPPPSFS